MEPLVSVLLPVRNASTHLARAMDSLLAQTLPDFEILAVDDHSDDGGSTRQLLEAYAGRDGRVRVSESPARGIAHALNHAAAMARGRFLARMDADDACHPKRLELQAALLEALPEVDVCGCRVAFGGDPATSPGYARHVAWVNALETHEAMALERFRDAPLAHPSAVLRASSLRQYGGYRQGPFPEDHELWLRWLEAGARLAKHPDTLLTWNDPPGRLSRRDPRYSPESFHAMKAAYLARWLAANNPHHPEVYVAGAGRVTRRRAAFLAAQGVRFRAYLDIDPAKIGSVRQGAPVLPYHEAPRPGEGFVVSYVSQPGAGEAVSRTLASMGLVHGRDYLLAG